MNLDSPEECEREIEYRVVLHANIDFFPLIIVIHKMCVLSLIQAQMTRQTMLRVERFFLLDSYTKEMSLHLS